MEETNSSDLTLRQLQIFWTVAHSGSITRAAKQLELRQPSISQQLSRMEKAVGGKLIRFVNNEMRLTPAGQFLLEEAGRVLGAVDRAQAGLNEFFEGRRGRVVVGALPSLARNLIVPAFGRLVADKPGYMLDMVEMTPREAIEQLHGRMIDMAVISGYAVPARLGLGLKSILVAEDAQLLAVPAHLPDLAPLVAPEQQLGESDLAVLRSTIRYAFASEHTGRIAAWYDTLLPGSAMTARCRSFESALAFVESGLGSAIVPELAVRHRDGTLFDVTLYSLPLPKRRTIVLMPDHYLTLEGMRSFVALIRDVAERLSPLVVRDAPAFAAHRLGHPEAHAEASGLPAP